MVNGQVNLYDAIRRQVDFKQGGKEYKLRTDRKLPTLIARARGWHLEEKHMTVDGDPMSASLFDFGLYFFHNAKELVSRGAGPYFYLPKMESHLEARLWNDVFNLAQDYIGMPRGTIRATVLIETISAAFEMDEVSVVMACYGLQSVFNRLIQPFCTNSVANIDFQNRTDHLRAQRPQLWLELRSMGLHLLLYQEIQTEPQFRPPRPLSCHHDCSIHGCLRQAPHQDLPPERRSRYGK